MSIWAGNVYQWEMQEYGISNEHSAIMNSFWPKLMKEGQLGISKIK